MSQKDNVLFTTRMRKATRKIHSISDALVNAKFALSLSDEKVWGGGLFVFYHVFRFLEDAKKRLEMPDFDSLFADSCLYRKEAFEEDLNYYLGDDWRAQELPGPLQKYLEHLEDLEKNNPQLLMAYVYHLYLGLLSGGQILARKRRVFGERNNEDDKYCDKVTDFGEVEIPTLKKDFKEAMNKIADRMTPEQQEKFMEESNKVFILNNSIVNSVGGQNQVVRELVYKLSMVGLVVAGIVIAYKMYR